MLTSSEIGVFNLYKKDLVLSEIAKQLSISRQRVHQVITKISHKIVEFEEQNQKKIKKRHEEKVEKIILRRRTEKNLNFIKNSSINDIQKIASNLSSGFLPSREQNFLLDKDVVLAVVNKYYDIDVVKYIKDSKRKFLRPRQMLISLLIDLNKMSVTSISMYLGIKENTVESGHEKIKNLMFTDYRYKDQYEEISTLLKSLNRLFLM